MRGQLVESPGYLVNYALGAFLTADIRARIRDRRGPLVDAGPTTWSFLVDGLYRDGAARPAGAVLQEFLGRDLTPDALFADFGRMEP